MTIEEGKSIVELELQNNTKVKYVSFKESENKEATFWEIIVKMTKHCNGCEKIIERIQKDIPYAIKVKVENE